MEFVMKRFVLLMFVFCTIPVFATTWYVRPDGGTRYSVNEKSGQCNGLYNAAYPGSGANQNCAFGDVRYLWTDGSYGNWGWVGAGGDKYLVNCPTDCRVGYSGPNDSSSDYFLGRPGDPASSGAPVPPSGTANAHTQILGANFANCASDSAKAHINGGYGTYSVFNLSGVSYVDLACFDITDHSSCGRQGQLNACSTNSPRSDFADSGIRTNNTTTNVTITDVRVHGLAVNGMVGATGTGVSLLRVALVGNASSGWNLDDGSGTTGTGTLDMNYFSVLWNGCAEEYPIVDTMPYQDCTDDNSSGYGDGMGTATTTSSPAWIMNITNSTAAYNTQDGFDLLHLEGGGSRLTITNSLAYGNMGQQLKVGAASTARNNLLIGNCNALRQSIPGTPAGYNSRLSDFCRAADVAVRINVQDSAPTYFQLNTLYSANTIGLEVNCSAKTTCTSLSTLVYQDNIFFGFLNNVADGYPSNWPYTGNYADPVYLDVPSISELFSNAGSAFSYNVTYHPKSYWTCPNTKDDETNGICEDPQLTDETWHTYGYGDMAPVSGSRVIKAGIAIPGVTVDYTGNTRPDPPSIGALEYGSRPFGDQIAINAAPDPATLEQPVTLTVTVAQTGSAVPTGSINFLNGSESLGRASLDSTGTASLVISWLPIGSYSVVGAYSGDSNYPSGESGVDSLEVLAATTTNLSASPNPVTAGQVLVLTAKVAANDSVSPTGTVTFLNGSTLLGTSSLNSSGVATLSTASLAPGTYSLTAKYGGDGNSLTSTSSAVSVTVKAESTTTSLAATPNPVAAGRELALTATVKGSTTSPTGTVSFMNGSTLLGTGTLSSSGVATLSTSSLAAGTYHLTAKYAGNTTSLASTSSAVSVTVTPAAQSTTTTLAAAPNPVTAGQPLVLTATAKGSTASPTGTVSFMKGSTSLGTSSLNSSGVATLSTASLAPGTYSLTAKYGGDGNSLTSTSSAVSVTVKAESTTTSLAATPNPVAAGRALALTATVKGSTISPTGTVSFMNGSTLLGTGTLSSSGVATLSTSSLAVGTYHLTAKYAGNATSLASTSSAVSVTVTAAAQSTTTTLAAASNPVTAGQPLALTATVKGSTASPTGTVSFMNGSTLLGTGTLNPSGMATFSTATLAPGTYGLTAKYGGDGNSLTSTSSAVSVTVTAAAQSTTTALAASPNPVTAGQPLVLTATVKGSTTSPTGTVSFMNGSTLLGTGTLNLSGVATFSKASFATGKYSFTAQYTGTSTYLASTSPAVSVTVAAAAQSTTTALVVDGNPVTTGQTLTLSATVEASGTTAPTAKGATVQAVQMTPQPTGTVSFRNGSKLLGTGTLDSSGVATLSTASLAPGTYSLTAEYSGSPSFLPSVSPAVSVTANAAAAAIVRGFLLYAPGSAQSEAKQTSGTALCTVAVPASGSQLGATVTYLSEDGSCGQQASR
jgi:hypothetical protein